MEVQRNPLTLNPHPLTQSIGMERSSLDILMKRISATIDAWSKENAHLFQDGTLALTDKAKLLCDKFATKGTETIVVGVNVSDCTAFQLGSKHGLNFLNHRSEILSDFFKFSKDSTLKVNTGVRYERVPIHHGVGGVAVSSGTCISQTGVFPSKIKERGVSGVGNLATQGILHDGQIERRNEEPSTVSMTSADSAHKNAVSTVSSETPLHIVSIQRVKEEPLSDEEGMCTGTDDTDIQQESVSVKNEDKEACTSQVSNSGDTQALSEVISASQNVCTGSGNNSNCNVVWENWMSRTGDSISASGLVSSANTPLDSNSASGHPSNFSTPSVTCQLVPMSMKYMIVPTSTSSEGVAPTSTSFEGAAQQSGPKPSGSHPLLADMISGDQYSRVCATSQQSDKESDEVSKQSCEHREPLVASQIGLVGKRKATEDIESSANKMRKEPENRKAAGSQDEMPPDLVIPPNEMPSTSSAKSSQENTCRDNVEGSREEPKARRTKKRINWALRLREGNFTSEQDSEHLFDEDESYKPSSSEAESVEGSNQDTEDTREPDDVMIQPSLYLAPFATDSASSIAGPSVSADPPTSHHPFVSTDSNRRTKTASDETSQHFDSSHSEQGSWEMKVFKGFSEEENTETHLDQSGIQGLPHPKTSVLPASKDQWKSTPQQRFKKVTEAEIQGLESETQSLSTKKNTKWGVAIFQEWHTETFGSKADFLSMSTSTIAEKLRIFYCEARPKKIEQRSKVMPQHHAAEYHRNTLKNIRAALNRHLHDIDSDIDIVRDKEFARANRALDGTIKNNKKQGMGRATEHKIVVITTPDLVKISTYLKNGYQTSPIVLRQAMWFTISFHFVGSSVDFHHQLRSDCFEFGCDENGDTYATLSKDALRDSFQGGLDNREIPTDHRMYAVPESDLCPLKLLNFYLNRLHPASTHLFNHCDNQALACPSIFTTWYNTIPLTRFSYVMRDIAMAADCTEKYTPGCVRATAIQSMKDPSHEIRQILFMSGDR